MPDGIVQDFFHQGQIPFLGCGAEKGIEYLIEI